MRVTAGTAGTSADSIDVKSQTSFPVYPVTRLSDLVSEVNKFSYLVYSVCIEMPSGRRIIYQELTAPWCPATLF